MDNSDFLPMTEGRLQANCFLWFHNTYQHLRGLLYHVPNGGKRDPREAALMKAKGVVPGIPDIVFNYKSRTYFFEFKEPGGKGVLSAAQKRIHLLLEAQGFDVWLIEAEEDFRRIVADILRRDCVGEAEKVPTKEDYFYRHSVFTYLYSHLSPGRVTVIAGEQGICADENLFKFVKCIEEFIDLGLGHAEGFEILFTPDYLAFYKKPLNESIDIKYKGKSIC